MPVWFAWFRIFLFEVSDDNGEGQRVPKTPRGREELPNLNLQRTILAPGRTKLHMVRY